jgi:Uma2 family endonuclease
MAARNIPWISPDEFLDKEAASETKHMYHAGLVTAMAGGSYEHGRLAGNLIGALFARLRGRGCGVVGSDVLFQTGSKEMFTYPDVMVICGPVSKLPSRPNVVTNPIFIAEVLSPSTEAIDRGAKSREYRASNSLRQYALISQDQPRVEIHTRDEAGFWRISEMTGLDSDCVFTGLDCVVPMAELYEGVLDIQPVE